MYLTFDIPCHPSDPAKGLFSNCCHVSSLVFSDKQKTQTFGVNSNGDTVSITNYTKHGNFVTEINHDKNNLLYTETNLYDGTKLVESISIDKRMNFNRKETYKYDNKGNEIENISYK